VRGEFWRPYDVLSRKWSDFGWHELRACSLQGIQRPSGGIHYNMQFSLPHQMQTGRRSSCHQSLSFESDNIALHRQGLNARHASESAIIQGCVNFQFKKLAWRDPYMACVLQTWTQRYTVHFGYGHEWNVGFILMSRATMLAWVVINSHPLKRSTN
jgi:hypothetical protein